MPSVLAIVSKAIFDKSAPRGAAPGAVFTTERYTSTNKIFETVGPGDAIFLVTVRPPSEQLWLVGILESPRFDGTSWVSSTNATPITDVTALLPQLRFASGQGLHAKPGTLGMSLQTPRSLSEEDVALLGNAAKRVRPEEPAKGVAPQSESKTPAPKTKPKAAVKGPKTKADTDAASKHWDAAAVLASLGAGFTTAKGEGELAEVVHTASGIAFLAVPGGRMVMGFTVDDVFSVFRAVNGNDSLAELVVTNGFAHSRPPRVVEMRPFLFARDVLSEEQHHENPDTLAAIGALGFRLPSDAEWEWVSRELGRHRFVSSRADAPSSIKKLDIVFERNGLGARGLLDEGERVADGWHDSYEGAPTTSAAWDPDRPPWGVRMGHTAIQGDEEVIALHAAFREKNYASTEKGGKRRARAALDWNGGEVLRGAPSLADTCAETLGALRGNVPRDRSRALLALKATGHGGFIPEEVDALAPAVLSAVADLDASDRAAALQILADLATGGFARFGDRRLSGEEVHAVPAWLTQAEAPLLKHLTDRDASVRAAATAIAALLPHGADAMRSQFKAEKNEEVRVSLLVALGCTGDSASPRAALGAKSPRLQGGAALGLVLAEGFPKSPSPELIAALAQNLCLSGSNEKLFPWFGHNPGRAVLRLVALGNPELLDAAVDSLLAAARESVTMRETLVGKALSLRFERLPEPKTTTSTPGFGRQKYRRQMLDPAQLSAKQRALLTEISRWPLASVRTNNLTELDRYGFPLELTDRRIWLGLDPPGVLDEPITTTWQGAPRQWPSMKEWLASEYDLAVATYDKDPARWPSVLASEAIKPVVDQWDPLMRLRVALEQHRLETRPAPIEPELDAALTYDRAATRAALEKARDRELAARPPGGFNHEILKLYLAALSPDELLDPRMDEVLVHSYADHSKVGMEHMPAERKKAFAERHSLLAHHGHACSCPLEKQGF